jgi:hypothetical protein
MNVEGDPGADRGAGPGAVLGDDTCELMAGSVRRAVVKEPLIRPAQAAVSRFQKNFPRSRLGDRSFLNFDFVMAEENGFLHGNRNHENSEY